MNQNSQWFGFVQACYTHDGFTVYGIACGCQIHIEGTTGCQIYKIANIIDSIDMDYANVELDDDPEYDFSIFMPKEKEDKNE